MMISYVCADFYNKKNERVFQVRPADIREFLYPPESIKEDPLYQMLLNDGSIAIANTEEEKKTLEKNMMIGIDAAGRKKRPVSIDNSDDPENAIEKTEETKPKATRGRRKAGSKVESTVDTVTETEGEPAHGPSETEQIQS